MSELERPTPPENPEATEQVKAFLRILQDEYGMSAGDLKDFRKDIQWMKAHHRQMEKIASVAGHTIIATLIAGVLLAFWEGMRHVLAHK